MLSYPIVVSIIIPVGKIDDNELDECLNSIKLQKSVYTIEVIVVQGGTIAQARNEGLRRAKGEYIVFIDSDCIATITWLSKLVQYYTALQPCGGVGGETIPIRGRDYMSKAIYYVFSTYLGSLGSTSLTRTHEVKEAKGLSTSNCLYRRETLEAIRGFDERYLMNEDTNLSLSLRKKGLVLYFVPETIVYHRTPSTYTDFAHKFFNWGVSRARSILTDWGHFRKKIVIPFLAFLLTILLVVTHNPVSYIVILIYTLVLIAYGAIHAVDERNLSMMWIIPTLYVLQHMSYCLGLIIGFFSGKYTEVNSFHDFIVRREVIVRNGETSQT